MQVVSIDRKFKVESTSVDDNDLLCNLDNYSDNIVTEYKNNNPQKCEGKTDEEILEMEENQQKIVTIEDVQKYIGGNCNKETLDKVNNYRSYVNKNPK